MRYGKFSRIYKGQPMGTGAFKNCRHCTKRFEVSRDWQLFCGDLCRQRWNYIEDGFCFYCGQASRISRDHIHPVCARTENKRKFAGQETVYSCSECNSTLGGKVFGDIIHRVQWLMECYYEKYKLNKGAVGWDDEELEELGPSLRQKIKHMLKERQGAERRVSYLRIVLKNLQKNPPQFANEK